MTGAGQIEYDSFQKGTNDPEGIEAIDDILGDFDQALRAI